MSHDPVKMADDFAVASDNRDLDERERQIRERLAAATPGPWEPIWDEVDDEGAAFGARFICGVQVTGVGTIADAWGNNADGELIANAPADLAYLLDALAAAREESGRLREALEGWPDKLYEIAAWLDVLDLAIKELSTDRSVLRAKLAEIGYFDDIDHDGIQRDVRAFADALRAALAREDGGNG